MAALCSVLVAVGGALVQCNDLGEFKGNTVTNIAGINRQLDNLSAQQAKSEDILRRLGSIETTQAVQDEKLNSIKDTLQKDRRR